jgi:hypothetical protein
MQNPDIPNITYAAPQVIEAGFALGQPVLDVQLDGQYAGCLFRSYRNAGRRLEETWQLHLKGGRPHGPKFETLDELILWAQHELTSAGAR